MASKRRIRDRQCRQKVMYLSRQKAEAEAFRLRQATGEKIQAYRCYWCKKWHVGHWA
jgi:hypothetical protein